ncbi:sulfurtransferase FdhD, partial [Vibrio parahaemolyticus]|nr:sulfurtransferase FdhD [Vibrio parahaemolyticus]
LPLSGHIVMVSGRSSFEIMQKCLVAGVPVVCAVSAPSSLAVEVARRFGMTLVGFLRGRRFNVYAGNERIVSGQKAR